MADIPIGMKRRSKEATKDQTSGIEARHCHDKSAGSSGEYLQKFEYLFSDCISDNSEQYISGFTKSHLILPGTTPCPKRFKYWQM